MHLKLILSLAITFILVNGGLCQDTLDVELDDDNGPVFCNATIQLSNAKGHMKFPSNLKGVNCKWLLMYNATVQKNAFYLHIEELNIQINDTFSVNNGNGDEIMKRNGPMTRTLLLTGAKSNITIELGTKNTTIFRHISIYYSSDPNTLPPIRVSQDDTLEIVSGPSFIGKTDMVSGLKIQLSVANKYENTQLIHIGFIENNRTFSIDGTQNNPTSTLHYNNTIGNLLSSEKGALSITLDPFKISSPDTYWKIYFSLVDKVCSIFTPITDQSKVFKTPLPKEFPFRSTLKCVAIYEAVNKTDIHLNINYTIMGFTNSMESLILRNGNQKSSSIIASINSENKNEMMNSYSNMISDSSLFLEYFNPQFQSGKFERFIDLSFTPTLNTGFYNKPYNVSYSPSGDSKHGIYAYRGEGNKNAILKFESQTQALNQGVLIVYSSIRVDDREPIASFTGNQVLPQYIYSPTNEFRLEFFNGSSTIKFELNDASDSCSSTAAVGLPGSFSLTGLQAKCGTECSWLIPATPDIAELAEKNETSVYTLYISSMLLSSPENCVRLYRYDEKKRSEIMTQCGNSTELTTDTGGFPKLLLNGNSTYVLEFSRHNTKCDTKDNSLLLHASVLEKRSHVCTSIGMDAKMNTTVRPNSYPGLYPVYPSISPINTEENFWVIRSSNETSKIYWRFDQLDLAPGHTLKLDSSAGNFEWGPESKLPDDVIVESGSLLYLKSPLQNVSSNTQSLSGEGFSVHLEDIECGGLLKTGNNISTGSFPNPLNMSKCIWIVNMMHKTEEKPKILNLTLSWGKNGTKGDLTVYDSPTIRDMKKVNLSGLNGENLASSQDHIIVVYENTSPKKPLMGLDITWTVKECPTQLYCGTKTERCILPEWICNQKNDCGNWRDEAQNCNSSIPTPPKPKPVIIDKGGLNGWVVTLVIIPLAILVGVISTIFGPPIVRKLRGRTYTEFQDFSEVS